MFFYKYDHTSSNINEGNFRFLYLKISRTQKSTKHLQANKNK